MNKPEDVIQRKLQGFLSVESLSDVATGSLEDGIGTINLNCTPIHSTEADPVMNGRLPLEVLVMLLFIHAQKIRNHMWAQWVCTRAENSTIWKWSTTATPKCAPVYLDCSGEYSASQWCRKTKQTRKTPPKKHKIVVVNIQPASGAGKKRKKRKKKKK